jgi:hypothetical protein
MKSALKPAIENLDKALARLESAVDKRIVQAVPSPVKRPKDEPQLELARNEREVNKKIAARLDQTISRLEMLLSEE